VNEIPCKELVVDKIIWAKYHHTFTFLDVVGSRHNIIKILFIGDHMTHLLCMETILSQAGQLKHLFISPTSYTLPKSFQ
jgi:hypothetical protein